MRKTGGYKHCSICNKEYYISGYRYKKSNFCSRNCWSKRNPPIQKNCGICEVEFTTYERESKKYCSFECRDEALSINSKGKNSHFWRGGKTKKNKLLRTNAKFREWRTKVFERDNYTCQRCGLKSKKGERIILHPHHIIFLSQAPELAYELDNGVTLCADCHQEVHSEINLSEKLTGKKRVKLN